MAFRRLAALVEVVLMIVLGRVEDHDLPDLRGGMVAHLHQLAEDFDGHVALRGVVEPNGGEVLRPDVDALAVGLLEVVDLEEIAHQGFIGDLLGVVFHFDGFQVPRGAGLDLFVARIFKLAAHEADRRLYNALEALEVIFNAPKATC